MLPAVAIEEIQIAQVIGDAMEMMKPAFDKRNIMVMEELNQSYQKFKMIQTSSFRSL